MRLLAIDTTRERCSVGVTRLAGSPILFSKTIGRGHAEKLMPMIAEAMAEASMRFEDLDRIAVTIGPGSFTGLRVGIAAARGLALVVGCPLVGVGTLDAIAERARELAGSVPVVAVLDARRDEVYAQLFNAQGEPMTDPEVGPAARFAGLLNTPTALAGSGATAIAVSAGMDSGLVAHTDPAPDIGAVARLGQASRIAGTVPRPLYLRPPDAKPQNAPALIRQ